MPKGWGYYLSHARGGEQERFCNLAPLCVWLPSIPKGVWGMVIL